MIKRLIQSGISLLVYFCFATIMAEVILLGYLGSNWKLNRNKLVQILAVLQDVDLFAIRERIEGDKEEISSEQLSYEQILEARALNVRHLELREQALADGLEMLQFEQVKLAEERKRYKQLRAAFDTQLREMQEGAVATGVNENIQILGSIKAKQAKEQLVLMLDNDELDRVVALLAGLQDVKRAKIIGEFKTPKEAEQLSDILRRIREGIPGVSLPEEMRKQLEQATPAP
ncbi:MAG: hypothetical protein JXB62_21010 [Pirellulales bacterium]|nr:hypothetical protein [Pirellulales bacterium]